MTTLAHFKWARGMSLVLPENILGLESKIDQKEAQPFRKRQERFLCQHILGIKRDKMVR